MTVQRWDGAAYDAVAGPQASWGAAVLDRLELRGDERVLDAGCGSGRVTELLAERLPRGHVVAVDHSASMFEAARSRLERFGPRVELVLADLAAPLPVEPPVDAVLSTATFHWIDDHDALFRNLAAVARPGASLAAQCGGAGQLAALGRAVVAAGMPWRPRNFADPETTERRLRAAGWAGVRCRLRPEPTRFDGPEQLRAFLRDVCLHPLLPELAEDRREAFVGDVARNLGEPVLDYVRLEIDARRA